MASIDNLPKTLKEQGQFCVWKYEQRDGSEKPTKVPYNPRTSGKAQSNNPSTFAPLSVAESVMTQYDGIGIGAFGDICAIDIDHCVDDNGALSDMAMDIIGTMNSYTEYSPSGKGIRILLKAPGLTYDKARYYINNQSVGLEVYVAGATNKYVTVTGNALIDGRDLETRTEELQTVLDAYMLRPSTSSSAAAPSVTGPADIFDGELLGKIYKSKSGDKFKALWHGNISSARSASEADLSVCNTLAFWTGRDAVRMDSMFRTSALMRDKWDEMHGPCTYGEMTIQKAITDCRETYNPQAYFQKASDVFTDEIPTEAAESFPFELSDEIPEKTTRTITDLHPDKDDRYSWSDIGHGYLFADWYRNRARYVPLRKGWFVYNGKVWRKDEGGLVVMELCKRLANALVIYALAIEEENQRKLYLAEVGKWQKRSYRETILKDAAGVYPVDFLDFDSDPYLLNCFNGTLNLKNRIFHPHNPDDLLSKMSGVNYNPEAKCSRWAEFISEIMQGDTERAVYLQKAFGYTLTGATNLDCLFVLYGPTTRNGKSTAMETFMKLMGEYGRTAKPETIAQKQTTNSNGPSEDIARLAGARFVNIPEPDKKLVLSTALVKTLTGGDLIPARFLNENSFEFRPQFKMFINTNHLPSITDVTLFNSGRVKIIPFERHFKPEERDTSLKDKLMQPDNLSGILNWCLEGLWLIDEVGFDMPESVLEATEEYKQNSDRIGRFISEEMNVEFNAEAKVTEVYERYQEWCFRSGYTHKETFISFITSLKSSVTIKKKRPANGGRTASLSDHIIGYKLNDRNIQARQVFSEVEPYL